MIVVCGEALIDLVPDDSSGQRWTAIPGGSPANAALAVARLGVPSALLARLSGDSFGRRLRGHLASNGVDLSLAIDAAEPSTLAIVELDETGAASYRFDIHGTADWQWSEAELSRALPPAVQAVHTGSMALTLPPGGFVLEGFLARAREGHTISIDPNIRPSLGVDVAVLKTMVDRWCGLADIVKASSEDVEVLYPGDELEAVARRWQALGPAVVLITLGAGGALAVTATAVHRLPAPPTVVVDTVAAGDTFTAGLLTSLHGAGALGGRLDDLSDDLLVEAIRYGLRAAAITCSRAGANPPYLSEMG
ncbi:carbohydrate kinase [Acidothermaceae bacterium B102]|nr:carbohydrate kinase [Acidothermaceae bacterium B102]